MCPVHERFSESPKARPRAYAEDVPRRSTKLKDRTAVCVSWFPDHGSGRYTMRRFFAFANAVVRIIRLVKECLTLSVYVCVKARFV